MMKKIISAFILCLAASPLFAQTNTHDATAGVAQITSGTISGVAITTSTYNGNTLTAGSSTYTGTAGKTYTFPTTSATVARTDADNSFPTAQTFTSNNGSIVIQPTTTSAGAFQKYVSTGGTLYFGMDTSTASQLGTAGNYGTAIYRQASTGFTISRGATHDITIDTTGHSIINSGTPTIASGACGATTNGTITGSDQAGQITISTAATTTCAVSFGSTWATAPRACTFSPANTGAAALTTLAYMSAISATGFTLTGSVLASTTWYFHCF